MKTGLKNRAAFSLETIGDIAVIMASKEKMKKLRRIVLLTEIPLLMLEWFAIILWIVKGIWWPFAVCLLVAVPLVILLCRYYYNNVKYICPECHKVFRPALKDVLWANHTPTTRKLTCTQCGHKGFCVEVWGGDRKDIVS